MAFQVTPDTDVAEAAMFDGVCVQLSSNHTIANATNTDVAWDTALWDTCGFFDSGSPGQVTVPDGVAFVKISSNLLWNAGGPGRRAVAIKHEGTAYATADNYGPSSGTGVVRMNIAGRVIAVSPGDVITVDVRQETGGSLDIRSHTSTYLQVEVIKTPFGRPDSPTLP